MYAVLDYEMGERVERWLYSAVSGDGLDIRRGEKGHNNMAYA